MRAGRSSRDCHCSGRGARERSRWSGVDGPRARPGVYWPRLESDPLGFLESDLDGRRSLVQNTSTCETNNHKGEPDEMLDTPVGNERPAGRSHDADLEWSRRGQTLSEPQRDRAALTPLTVVRLLCRALALRLDAVAVDRRDRGQARAALRLHRLAVVVGAAGFDASDRRMAQVLNNHGVACKFAGRYDEGRRAYARALTVFDEALVTDLALLATLLHNIAGLDHARGQPQHGEPRARLGLAIREAIVAPNHPDVAADLTALAAIVDAQGRFADADVMYARALAIFEQTAGPRPLDVAVALNNRGAIAQREGRTAEAETAYRRALAVKEAILGHHHPELAPPLNNLALLLRATGRQADAEAILRRAVRVAAPALGTAHPTVQTYRHNLDDVMAEHPS